MFDVDAEIVPREVRDTRSDVDGFVERRAVRDGLA
jgi:hypothetical protein